MTTLEPTDPVSNVAKTTTLHVAIDAATHRIDNDRHKPAVNHPRHHRAATTAAAAAIGQTKKPPIPTTIRQTPTTATTETRVETTTTGTRNPPAPGTPDRPVDRDVDKKSLRLLC